MLDSRVVDCSRVHGPRQVSDAYLLALAVRRSGRFVIFDHSVALSAVLGATAENLTVL
jgi:predicted nucleic acid-binding protein